MASTPNNNPKAVIDLGTNTFHLLIATFDGTKITEVLRNRRYVYLAENGIANIGQNAFHRAIEAVKDFKCQLQKQNITHLTILGTEGLRRASNASSLIDQIEDILESKVQIISGTKEAILIGSGTLLAIEDDPREFLVMDIGGGSVEFIHLSKGQIEWTISLPIGIAVLKRNFHHSEPILANEISEIMKFVTESAFELIKYVHHISFTALIGASGSFEVLQNMTTTENSAGRTHQIKIDEFNQLYDTIMNSDLEARKAIPGLPEERAHLIVGAMILIKVVLENIAAEHIWISPYAMKEGAFKYF